MKTLSEIKAYVSHEIMNRLVGAVTYLIENDVPDGAPDKYVKLREKLIKKFIVDDEHVSDDQKYLVLATMLRDKHDEDGIFDADDIRELDALSLEGALLVREFVMNALIHYYKNTPEGKIEFLRSPHSGKTVEEAVELLMQDLDRWLFMVEEPQFNEEETLDG